MRLNELKKLINETIQEEKRASNSFRKKGNWGRVIESTVKRVLVEAEEGDSDVEFSDVYGDTSATYGSTPADKLAGSDTKGLDNKFLSLGDGSNDAVEAGSTYGPVAASKLKASQKEVLAQKSIGFAAGFLKGEDKFKPEGNIGGIITSDGQILDGHHRWAGAYIVNPASKLEGTKIDLRWQQAVPVLRAIGIAFGHKKGNMGGSAGSVWGKSLSKEEFSEIFSKAVEKGGGWDKLAGVKKYCGNEFSDFNPESDKEKLINYLYSNYKKLESDGKPPNGMPDRVNMPVLVAGEGEDKVDEEGNPTSQKNTLGSDEVKAATELVNKGKIDIKPEYHDELEKAVSESVITRWNKLAGILKG